MARWWMSAFRRMTCRRPRRRLLRLFCGLREDGAGRLWILGRNMAQSGLSAQGVLLLFRRPKCLNASVKLFSDCPYDMGGCC